MSSAAPVAPPAEEADDILLLSVDSLRLDRLRATRSGEPVMPNLREIAADGIEIATGVTPGPATPDSVPSMLTGSYPSQFPGFTLPESDTPPQTLAEQLSERGFETAAFHQNNLISRQYNFDRGFDHYYDISEETREETGRGTWRLRLRNLIEGTPLMRLARVAQTVFMEQFGRSLYVLDEPGDSLTDRAIDWLDDTAGRRFLWVHYMDAHHPYISPPEVQRTFGRELPKEELLRLSRKARSDSDRLTDEEVADLEYAYDCSVRFVDEQLGRLLDHLERTSDDRTAMVAITADHGEEFLEHGEFGHRDALWDELITVPLVVRYPLAGEDTVDGQAPVQALVDTIVDGDGLFGVGEDGVEYIISETREGREGVRCCRGNGYKLIVDGDERTVTRVSDDGEQVVDAGEIPSDVRAEMERLLEQRHETHGETGGADREALREDLAALGYLEE